MREEKCTNLNKIVENINISYKVKDERMKISN
jgi:hypothetical protein